MTVLKATLLVFVSLILVGCSASEMGKIMGKETVTITPAPQERPALDCDLIFPGPSAS